ncbi:hypothetical protein GCM10009785_23190 [Brooklawnia cerclae]|uniref:Divalent metal cation (Fe/Co/Zn/Cd) transporter n=1 Tax=Brooklawnia cerclae TaxID=349934 RepID=A0ABX0SGE2_9ACTN|nr:hypothetical protein [Brooklawnia cerclae]NIH57046.1 divalent metal cation (Fe/Co/Zn/Cd) transporter [Brooklawnia cerclae]
MTVLLIIGAAGIVLLLLALFVGDVLEGGLGVDAVAGFDSDVFSTAGVAGLLGGFGFGGALGLELSGLMWVGVVVGVVVGVLLGWGAGRLTRLLRRQGSDVALNTSSLVGVEALVLTAIPEEGYGQVRLSHGGHTVTLNAKAPIPLEVGTRVWVSGVLSATSVEVLPVDALPGSDVIGR